MKTVLMGLIFSMIAGFGTASAAQDYATLIAQAEEFAKATEEASDDEDKAPSWDTYVTDDADTAWATITDAIGDEEAGEANSELMTSASPEAIQAITIMSGPTPRL